MNREARQEIRRALLGRTQLAQDGRLTVLEKGQFALSNGVADGAGAVRFLGVCRKSKRLRVNCPETKARQLAVGVMGSIGRGLYLSQQPEAAACVIRYVLTRPAVLVFAYQDGIPVLTAFSGRSLTGWLSNRRALRSFIRNMPQQFSVSEKPVPVDKDEEQEKKAKEEKRRARQAEKLARQEAKKQKKDRNRRRQAARQDDQAAESREADAAETRTEGTNE
ncbi:MAG: hypothetical protein II062_00205 [Oscillospiraceae bacterium]|nr:hypothetical protein [Oscillospiraceae bacterium]MBR7010840.1 hypothetical protein [Oscillospiraceae bacterium]